MDKRTLIKPNNYLTVQGWMITDLGLASNSLLVYAAIYGFSQDGVSWFEGTREYLAEWCGRINVKTVSRVLDDLVQQGLIEKKELTINRVRYCNYRAVLEAIPGRHVPDEEQQAASLEECQRGTKGVGTFCPHPENSDTIKDEIRQIAEQIRNNNEQHSVDFDSPMSKGSEGGRDILSPVGTICPEGRDILSPHNININSKKASNNLSINLKGSVSEKDDRLIDPAGADETRDIEAEIRTRIGVDEESIMFPDHEEREQICVMIADVLKSRSNMIRIGKEDLPAADVKNRFRKLDRTHVDYVLECLRNRSGPRISNYRQYVLRALYNAPTSISGYYAAEVRADQRALYDNS